MKVQQTGDKWYILDLQGGGSPLQDNFVLILKFFSLVDHFISYALENRHIRNYEKNM
jgi:hypothetical protein